MNPLIRMFRDPRGCVAVTVSLLGLGLAGCNQLERIDEGDSDGESGIPSEVRAAFERSCGKSGCHVSGGTDPTLVGGSLDELVGTKYVTIGDIPGSYIAVKMLPDPTLEALGVMREGGVRMPLDADFTNPSEVTLADSQTILAWIAGAEFAGGEGGTTGDTASTGDGESTGEPLPTFAEVQKIFMNSCSCHAGPANAVANGNLSLAMADAYANIVDKPSDDIPGMNLITPKDPENSYLYLKVARTPAEIMTAGGSGGTMPIGGMLMPDQLALIEQWIAAGAPND